MSTSNTVDLKEIQAQVENQMKSAFTELYGSLKERLDKQDNEIKTTGETTDTTAAAMSALSKQYDELTAEFEGKVAEMQKRFDAFDVEAEKKSRRVDIGAVKFPVGDQFANSEQLKKYIEHGFAGKSGPIPVPSISMSRPGELNYAYYANSKEGLGPEEAKALTGIDNLRELWSLQNILEVQRDPARPMNERMRDVIPVVATTKDTIQYAEETVAELNAATVAMGGTKPESNIQYSIKRVPVEVIAHWIPIANQLLDDLPALRPYVELRMREGLLDEEDDQFLYGSGTAPDLLGFFQHPGVQTYDPAVDGQAKDNIRIDSIRRAMVKVRKSQFRADAVVMSPFSLAEIELAKGDDGHYLWTLPSSPTPTTIWRLPIVESTAIQDDDFLLGSFRKAATIYNRMDATLRIADQHLDFFIKNMSALLMEHRVTLVIWRPMAFVAGSFSKLTS